jgi:hypothetical protein
MITNLQITLVVVQKLSVVQCMPRTFLCYMIVLLHQRKRHVHELTLVDIIQVYYDQDLQTLLQDIVGLKQFLESHKYGRSQEAGIANCIKHELCLER